MTETYIDVGFMPCRHAAGQVNQPPQMRTGRVTQLAYKFI